MNVICKRSAIHKIPYKDYSGLCIGEKNRCFNTRLYVNKCDLKPINMAKLKDELNKRNALVKHCFKYERKIDL